MRDVLMTLLIAAFFAMCMAYVAWCDRIIGPDTAPTSDGRTDFGPIDMIEPVPDHDPNAR